MSDVQDVDECGLNQNGEKGNEANAGNMCEEENKKESRDGRTDGRMDRRAGFKS